MGAGFGVNKLTLLTDLAKRGCPGSMNRAHCLQEGIIMLGHRKIHTSFDCRNFPLLFIAEEVSSKIAIEHLLKCLPTSTWKDEVETAFSATTQRRVPVTDRRSNVPVLYVLEVEGNGAQCLNIGCAFRINDRITISNTEILQCNTFTKCIVCILRVFHWGSLFPS